jgi:hypothetical protein
VRGSAPLLSTTKSFPSPFFHSAFRIPNSAFL